ncbi:MotA/TolQ/ExbB proton channel family protein [Lysobacter sp. LF1]|uniref:MotA/TolQ/ExbB proton channel family protein n=1 Tax=Lysobacter stagni TaxID=3045172 RepID=A0ABT6XBW5_9GAMM|nr:MotA/TolQ/ExbB proton channel family protein [Lysobacter sp. LF1]MDI9237638.1 MotA/TolQ/ExbB proton channel family protein [Lysobacter sp. LF1]
MMFPILLVGLIGLAIAVERWVTIARAQSHTKAMWAKVEPSLTEGDFEKARKIVGNDNNPLGRLLGAGLSMQGAVRRRDDVEKAMQEGIMEIVPRLEKRTHYLGTFANLATLVGLLGTVSGLIGAFSAVATANPAEKANMLSASISEAMNCTAFGLGTAVPLLFLHAFLTSRTQHVVESLEMAAIKYLNVLSLRTARMAQGAVQNIRDAA